MVTIRECKRDTLCVDCDNLECLRAGDVGADCPKYHCDNAVVLDCENCTFIREYQQAMRDEEEL